jgi:hypothetical protein
MDTIKQELLQKNQEYVDTYRLLAVDPTKAVYDEIIKHCMRHLATREPYYVVDRLSPIYNLYIRTHACQLPVLYPDLKKAVLVLRKNLQPMLRANGFRASIAVRSTYEGEAMILITGKLSWSPFDTTLFQKLKLLYHFGTIDVETPGMDVLKLQAAEQEYREVIDGMLRNAKNEIVKSCRACSDRRGVVDIVVLVPICNKYEITYACSKLDTIVKELLDEGCRRVDLSTSGSLRIEGTIYIL